MDRGRPTRPDHNGARYRAKRDQILDVAVAAFRRRGYAGTSIQDISRSLQLTKGSLYYYFRDKEDILYESHERSLDHLLSIARAVRRDHPEPAAALRRLIEEHAGIMVHEFRGSALALEVGHLQGERLARVVRRRDRYEGALRGVIEEGIRTGVFRPVDPKLAAFAILGAINWMARWYHEGGGHDPETIGRAFADLFVASLRRPRSGRRGVPRPRARRRPRPTR